MQLPHEAVGKLYTVNGAHPSACRGRIRGDTGDHSTAAERLIERDGCMLWAPSARSVGKFYISNYVSSCPKAPHHCRALPANRLQRAVFVAIPATARTAAENLTNRDGCTLWAPRASNVGKFYT